MNIVYGTNPKCEPKDFLSIQLLGVIRLIEKVGDTVYLLGDHPLLIVIENLTNFNITDFFELVGVEKDGFYFANHYTNKGNYLGPLWIDAVEGLKDRRLATSFTN